MALPTLAQESSPTIHLVQPGDTWTALALRYQLDENSLRASQMNQQREPVIGQTITLPAASQQMGQLVRVNEGGLLATAVRSQTSPWQIALHNNLTTPHQPTLYQPLLIPGGSTPPRDLPIGLNNLELSQIPAHPGQALAYRATGATAVTTAHLNLTPFDTLSEDHHHIGLVGTGAFFGSGTPELTIQTTPNSPLWVQPWLFVDPDDWAYQQLTLTGEAAQIDAQSIQEERERLFTLWATATPAIHWHNSFQLPINDYLELTSDYGARRSYNGGPYRSYHEGVDFAAFAGTPVTAPAAGTVVLAERLFVRGGAVIIDHGFGVYSGFYHMSAVHAAVGQQVQPGDLLGEVGTTGLSTGNHLHWDLLVADTWVDAWAWWQQDMACWLLAGLERPCSPQN
ncbi:MAG: LysM peptidoglycan-binding domain-containing M23 family metallopeptidase [Ardenticatenaceae bacterium]|nr:LysM peptidoglycan-binding domain-containing M23 family metallopeptidase [Ardenticatenaceae bacterium]